MNPKHRHQPQMDQEEKEDLNLALVALISLFFAFLLVITAWIMSGLMLLERGGQP